MRRTTSPSAYSVRQIVQRSCNVSAVSLERNVSMLDAASSCSCDRPILTICVGSWHRAVRWWVVD